MSPELERLVELPPMIVVPVEQRQTSAKAFGLPKSDYIKPWLFHIKQRVVPCEFTPIRFMVLHKKDSPLARLMKSLIAMNSHSQSSKDARVSQMDLISEGKLAANSVWE